MPKSPSKKRPASLAASTGLFMASTVAAAGFEGSNNLAVYWGQNSYGHSSGELSQQSLATYCANSAIDIIPLSFLVQINSGQGGLPSLNLANTGNGCEVFPGTSLLNCPQIGEDIKTCQTQYNKTILLSIGGATYTEGGFADDASAIKAADLIWSMFGPLNADAGNDPVPTTSALTSTLSSLLTGSSPLTLTASSLTDVFSSSIPSSSTASLIDALTSSLSMTSVLSTPVTSGPLATASTSCSEGSLLDTSATTDATSASVASVLPPADTEAVCSAISTTTTELAGMIWTIVLPGPTPVAPGQVVTGSVATSSESSAFGILPAGSGVAFGSTSIDSVLSTPSAAEAVSTPSPTGSSNSPTLTNTVDGDEQPLTDITSEAVSTSAVDTMTSSSSVDSLTASSDSSTATVETTASSSDVGADTASLTSPPDVVESLTSSTGATSGAEATGEAMAGEPVQAEGGDDSESDPLTVASSIDPSITAMVTSAPSKAPTNVVTIISSVTSIIRTSFATFTIEAIHVSESTPPPGGRVEESGSTLSVPAAPSASGPSVVNYDGTSGELVRRQEPAPAAPLRPFGDAIVDGFDLDIESVVRNFKPFAKRLRELMDSSSSSPAGASAEAARKYYLTSAPQCPFPDAAVGELLSSDIAFDAVFVQFYNNYCGINSFVPGTTPTPAAANNRTKYPVAKRFGTLKARQQNNFNFETWDNWAKTGSANKNVKVFLGVPAGQTAAGTGYLSWSDRLKAVIDYSKTFSSFGGVMMWDASQAVANKGFLEGVKAAVGGAAPAADPVTTSGSVAATSTSELPPVATETVDTTTPAPTPETTSAADVSSIEVTETPSAPVDGSAPAVTEATETMDSTTAAPTPDTTSSGDVSPTEITETPSAPVDGSPPAATEATDLMTNTTPAPTPESTDPADATPGEVTETSTASVDAAAPSPSSADNQPTPDDSAGEPEVTDGSDIVDGPIDEDAIEGEEDPEDAVETLNTEGSEGLDEAGTTEEPEGTVEPEAIDESETGDEPEFTEGQTGSVDASPAIGRDTQQKRYEIFGRIGRRWVA